MVANKFCVAITAEITDLANRMQGETPASISNLVGLWWELDSSRLDTYPTVTLLGKFRDSLRVNEENPVRVDNSSFNFETPEVVTVRDWDKVDKTFNPRTRRDRVTLLARLFSNEVSKAVLEITDNLLNRIDNSSNLFEINELSRLLLLVDRLSAIRNVTALGLFERVLKPFRAYVNASRESKVLAALDEINSDPDLAANTLEVKLEAAQRRVDYTTNEFLKIINNARALILETSGILSVTEGIRIDVASNQIGDINLAEDTPEGESLTEELADDENREELVKDGWMLNTREISAHEALSLEVRKVISLIPRLDNEGYIITDDLGFERYLDADYVHAVLIDKLRNMTAPELLLDMLRLLERTKPWAGLIIELLESDEKLFSLFYVDFRKDFLNYWIQRVSTNTDGTMNIKTISVNTPEGIYFLLNEWRDNYESGNRLDNDSIYNQNGSLNQDNALKGLGIVLELTNLFTNTPVNEMLDLLDNPEVFTLLLKLLNMAGISVDSNLLEIALTDVGEDWNSNVAYPILLLLENLNIIFSGVSRKTIDLTKGDLINQYNSAYSSIASQIGSVTEDAIESSIRENDKSYYSHTVPSYLGKMIKRLKNVLGDYSTYADFIFNEFGLYEWFYKDGLYLNDWVELLVNNPELRNVLDHKVLLNSGKRLYADWDSVDVMTILLNEYWSSPASRGLLAYAWYNIPIMSDALSSEFIKFVRYRTGDLINESGEDRTYLDILLDKYANLVLQEYNRIVTVIERDKKITNGDPNIKPITNYDIERNNKGEITYIGGAEFKFLPALNDYRREGDKLATIINNLQKTGNGALIIEVIKEALNEVLETLFELDYVTWFNSGLMEELENGKMRYLPFVGLRNVNKSLATAMYQAKLYLGNTWTGAMENILQSLNNGTPYNDRIALNVFNQIKDTLNRFIIAGQGNLTEVSNIISKLRLLNIHKEALREFFWNSTFASSLIVQLTTTDLAYYRGPEDFLKRFKEIHSPANRLNTMATYKGEKIGREFERTLYIADEFLPSESLTDIDEVLLSRVDQGLMTKLDKDFISSLFKRNNVTDGLSFRTLSSTRSVLGMIGEWDDLLLSAYDNFVNGTWTIEDFNILWLPRKPFVYTLLNKDSGVNSNLKVPTLHKNSEFLLAAMYDVIAGPMGRSAKLRALSKFAEDNNIDVISFNSVVKVGPLGVVNLNGLNTEAEVLEALNREVFDSEGVENPNVIHKIPYEDFGILQLVPEHFIEASLLVGTLIRALITSDISPDTLIEVEGRSMNKLLWFDLYNQINTENIIESFSEVDEIFSDPKEIELLLIEEIRNNSRYSSDMMLAVTLDENGRFNLPLFEPALSLKVLALINSVIKSRITKLKIKGGSLVLVSNFGLTDELKIVFEGEGNNKRIKYYEAYLPWYSREYIEPLLGNNNLLDINRLPEELRRVVGYRIPTEDKYSMIPIYIKGFLPQTYGGSIMLPLEITTLTGADFDIDKLYVMLPEFRINRNYDRERFILDLIEATGSNLSLEERDLATDNIRDAIRQGDTSPEDSLLRVIYNNWLLNRLLYRRPQRDRIEKVKYDFSKSALENNRLLRNNLMIDMMWGILTNADTASKMINPGGFEPLRRSARILYILLNMSEDALRKELGINSNQPLYLTLNSLSIGRLNLIRDTFARRISSIDPQTFVLFHLLNMTGAKLIGIFANHNKNHAFLLHTLALLNPETGGFVLNGKMFTSLHNILNDKSEYISKNNANYLAASVDNVKDPVLSYINLNTFTADIAMLLSRLGYNTGEVGLFLSQPIVIDLTNRYFREARSGKDKNIIIEEVLEEYRLRTDISSGLSYDNYKNNKFLIEELAENIVIAREALNITDITLTSDLRKIEFYKKLLAVGYLFQRVFKTSDALSNLVRAMKFDALGGGAGPTIADTELKMQRIIDFNLEALDDSFPLMNVDVINTDINLDLDINSLRLEINRSPIPFLLAFYTLGVAKTERLLGDYFPLYNESFRTVIDVLRGYNKSGRLDVKTMNNIYNELLTYIMNDTSFFGNELVGNPEYVEGQASESVVYSRDKRNAFINRFPSEFRLIVKDNPDIADLEFIKRLKVIPANRLNPVETIVFKNVGQLSSTLRENYMRDWSSLLYMDNPVANQLALNLFRYSTFRNGFAFGPNTFIHLAPTVLKLSIPEYRDRLYNILDNQDDYSSFVDQYVLNHLDNRRLVPEVPLESNTKFETDIDGERGISDEVVISINEASNSADRKVIRRLINTPFGTEYEFFKFIARKYLDNFVYYKLLDSQSDTVIYERVDPLGFKNSFIEYEYNRNASEVESVIDSNDRNYNPNSDNYIISYENPLFTDEDVESGTERFLGSTDAIAEAYSLIMGAPLTENTDSQTLESYNPNTDFRDVTDELICNLPTIGTL